VSNKDNTVNYKELFNAVKADMSDQNISHKPVYYPEADTILKKTFWSAQNACDTK
jgi:hypothetical protein